MSRYQSNLQDTASGWEGGEVVSSVDEETLEFFFQHIREEIILQFKEL